MLKEGNVLFNDALNTFYLRLYGVGHMVKGKSDSERGKSLPPNALLCPISSKGSFICTIRRQDIDGLCYTSRGALAGTRNNSQVLKSHVLRQRTHFNKPQHHASTANQRMK